MKKDNETEKRRGVLQLTKTTVSNLSNVEMNRVVGGYSGAYLEPVCMNTSFSTDCSAFSTRFADGRASASLLSIPTTKRFKPAGISGLISPGGTGSSLSIFSTTAAMESES